MKWTSLSIPVYILMVTITLIGCSSSSIENPVEVDAIVTNVVERGDEGRYFITVKFPPIEKSDHSHLPVGIVNLEDYHTGEIVLENDEYRMEYGQGHTIRIRYEKDHPEKAELAEQ